MGVRVAIVPINISTFQKKRMIVTKDHLGIQHQLDQVPSRIVSLVPSITELICDLGLQNNLVGCTKFCVHPKHLRDSAVMIGGTKKVNIERIKSLSPDLIFANKEENVQDDVEALRDVAPVWVSDIKTWDDSLSFIEECGIIFSRESKAGHIITILNANVRKIMTEECRAAYLIWKNPWMTVGGDTYIHSVIKKTGFTNVFGHKKRYPETDLKELKNIHPDIILLSSEPFPFKSDHVDQLSQYLPKAIILLVDGEYFSWYGSRQMHLSDYADQLRCQLKPLLAR